MAKKKAKIKKSTIKKKVDETIEDMINDESETIVDEILLSEMNGVLVELDELAKTENIQSVEEIKPIESKEAKFIRLFESRINKALKMLSNIGNLSNATNYKFTEEQYIKGLVVLSKKLHELETKFEHSFNKKNSIKESFKL